MILVLLKAFIHFLKIGKLVLSLSVLNSDSHLPKKIVLFSSLEAL